MYTVGDYILVEPFELEKTTSLILGEKAEREQISMVGTVVAVGNGEGVSGLIEQGAIVHLHSGCMPVRIGAKHYFRATIDSIAVCYDNKSEYKRIQREEKEEDERRKARERMALPEAAISMSPN